MFSLGSISHLKGETDLTEQRSRSILPYKFPTQSLKTINKS